MRQEERGGPHGKGVIRIERRGILEEWKGETLCITKRAEKRVWARDRSLRAVRLIEVATICEKNFGWVRRLRALAKRGVGPSRINSLREKNGNVFL